MKGDHDHMLHPSNRNAISKWIALFSVLLVLPLIGCGGGGGHGSSTPRWYGRSYSFSSGGRTFVLSVDSNGRFTAFAQDSSTLSSGTGGQGSITANGQFFAQSEDGNTQFLGTFASNGDSVSGTVQRNAVSLFSYTASRIPPGRATTSALIGTFSGISGSNSAYISYDQTSHGTLWLRYNGATAGGLLIVADDGSFQTTDNATAGRLIANTPGYTLRLTKINDADVNVDISLTKTQRARWTFLVFINAANDLQPFGPLNVNQMEKIGSFADLNIVVQWKQAACATCGRPDWIGTRRYYITKDNDTSMVTSKLIEDMGTNIDMGDWRELRKFITWTQERYPADRYALVIWNHGAGWRSTRSADGSPRVVPRSVSIDDSTNREIKVWELPSALSVTPKMDMVIFDASLMQMLEVAYEIRDMAQIMVGSEESPPGEGYVYDTFLADLAENPNMSAEDFGRQIVARTIEAYGRNSNITQSALHLNKIQTVAERLHDFANALRANIGNNRAAMVDARMKAQNYTYPENKDLWHYAQLIRDTTSTTAIRNAVTSLQTALSDAIFAEDNGSLLPNSNGLAIYIPAPTNYLSIYGNLALARSTVWDEWLKEQPQNP
jgi:hypothetical protein